MSQTTHFPWAGMESARAACGRLHPALMSEDTKAVTCQRCRLTVKFKEALSVASTTVRNPEQRAFALSQEQAVDQQRNFTIREVLDYLREGDRESAYQRLMVGFNRQVRLSGLEAHLREGATS